VVIVKVEEVVADVVVDVEEEIKVIRKNGFQSLN
jgi:hypothetical protein